MLDEATIVVLMILLSVVTAWTLGGLWLVTKHQPDWSALGPSHWYVVYHNEGPDQMLLSTWTTDHPLLWQRLHNLHSDHKVLVTFYSRVPTPIHQRIVEVRSHA